MLATLLCTAPHHHSILDDSPVRTTFAPSFSSPSCCSSTSLNDRHADAAASSPGSGPSTLPPSSDATATAVATTATTFTTPQKKPTTGSPYRRAPIPMLRKQRRQFSLSLGGGGTSNDKNAACASEQDQDQDQDQAADTNANANASTSSFTVLSLKSTFAFAALRRSGSVNAAGTGSGSNAPSGRRGRWARARLRNASASAASGGDTCFVVAEGPEGADTKAEKAKAGKAKICIGAPSGFRHEFHLGLGDNPNPSKELWDEVRWRQVIETRMDTMGAHVGLHENENETLSPLHPDTDAKTQRFVKSVDFSTLAAASTSPSPPTVTPPGTSAVVATTSLTPTTTPVRPPRNPKRASANTFTGSVTPEQFANLGAKLAAMEAGAGAGAQVQGVEDALAKLTGTHVRSVSAPGIPEDGILNGSPNRSTTTPKPQKRASLVKRKPVPRLGPEEELALGSSSPPSPPPVPPLPSAPAVMSSQSMMQNQQHQHKLKQQRKSVSTYLLIPDLPAAEPVVVARKSLEAAAEGKNAGEKENGLGRSGLESAGDAQIPESRTFQTTAAPQETQSGSRPNEESTSVSPAAKESGDTDASPRPSLSSLSSSASSSGGESAESGGMEDSEESEAFSTPPMTPLDECASRDMDTIFGNAKFGAEVTVAEPGNETEGVLDVHEKDVVVARRTDGKELLGSVV